MLDFRLTPEEFGLVRMGRKRSIIRVGGPIAAGVGLGIATILNAKSQQTLSAVVVRFSATRIANLTQEDAVKAGFLYLHQLTMHLMGFPDTTEDTSVSIFEFRCEGDDV